MNTRNRHRRTRQRGFTLLEILLVVGLLALLASIAIPALTAQAEKAKVKMVEAVIGPNGTLSQAIKQFRFDIGHYPEELMDLIEKPGDAEMEDKWTTPYLEDESGLKDPWSHDFEYAADGTHNEGSFDLWSIGPDNTDGTDDDITNWKDDR